MTWKIVKLSLKTIFNNKMRSFLTMLGIIIGVMAVVILVSITQGAASGITDSISDMGSQQITATISSEEVSITADSVESLSSYMDVSEDLARRIINQQNLLLSFSQSVSVLKTRELTQTRIQRALLHIILNIHTAPTQIPFARVLGFRKESSELLSRIKQHSRIPLITKLANAQNLLDSEGNPILSETVFSSNLYEKLLCLKTGRKFCHESQKQLIIL